MMQTALRVLAVAFVVSIAACNPFDDEEPGGGGTKPPVLSDCQLTGTMVRITCGASIYDNLWIKMADGKFIQPCEQSFQTFRALEFKEGDRVSFSYRALNGPSACTDMYTCLAAVPPHTSAVIDCISTIAPGPGCEQCPALKVKQLPEGGHVNVLEASVSGDMLKLKIGYSGCGQMSDDEFVLSWNGSFVKTFPAHAELFINAEREELCQAYFTKELCFNIKSLKLSGNQQVVIDIQGKELVY